MSKTRLLTAALVANWLLIIDVVNHRRRNNSGDFHNAITKMAVGMQRGVELVGV